MTRTPQRYRFPITITNIFERKLKKHVSGAGENAIFTTESEGWYIEINRQITIFLGNDKPSFEVGEKADLAIIRK